MNRSPGFERPGVGKEPEGHEAPATSSRRGAWSWLLAIGLAALLLYASIRGVDWRFVGRTIAGARWGYVLLAVGITVCSFLWRGVRWRILLNAKAELRVTTAFCANMA